MKKGNIVLLHGALGCKKQLESLHATLSEKWNTYSFDFKGHGSDSGDTNFSIQSFSKQLHGFLIENKIQKTNIFGYSMGGYVALYFALHHPEHLDHLVTLGTKFNWNKSMAQKEVAMLNPSTIEVKVPAFAKRLDELHSGNNWKTVVAKTAQMMIDLGDNPLLDRNNLQTIQTKTLIGIGALDNMVTLDESEKVSQALPNGKLIILPDCKHPIEKVDTNQLAQIILNFLE